MLRVVKSQSLIALVFIGILFFSYNAFAEELREWKSSKGVVVKASFVKVKDGYILLKLESGKVVQTLAKNLCAKDRAYIMEMAHVARDVEVVYLCDLSGCYKERGVSPAAMIRDKVTFKIIETQMNGGSRTRGDSRWVVQSVEIVEKKMVAVDAGLEEELTSEGKFVLVKFSMENDSPIPVTPPPPLLVDQRGRKYLPIDNYKAKPFIHQGALQPEKDVVQPGFKKIFCSIYEVPPALEAEAVEIFPAKVAGFSVRQLDVSGKRVNLKFGAVEKRERPKSPLPSPAPSNFNVFLKCKRLSQGGGKTSGYYYDYNRKRSLAYGVELRTTSKKPEALRVKAFFIGQMSNGKDVVVDQKESGVDLQPGRIERMAFQSIEISQYHSYYYGSSSTRTSAKLAGVIIQVWQGDKIFAGYASVNQWNKYIKSKKIIEEMGVLRSRQDQ